MVYNKANYNKDINTIIPNGFIRVENYCMFKRNMNKHTEIIYYSHRDYFPHGFYIEGVSIAITFNKVEDILKNILDKYQIQQRYGESTIHAVLYNIEGIDYSKFDTEIHDESSFQIVAEEIKKIVENGALPFFEKYDTLESLNKEIDKRNDDNINDFLSGIIRLKVPLIKKIIKVPDFRDELIKSKIFYEGEALLYPQYFKDHDKVFFDLFSEDLKEL